eukprot:m.349669 g.349669  ORF g.349669 m.349669 type:complete len:69 (+) comp16576_c0_seq4:3022-3228(+)
MASRCGAYVDPASISQCRAFQATAFDERSRCNSGTADARSVNPYSALITHVVGVVIESSKVSDMPALF